MMLRNRCKELEERIGELDRDDLLDELDQIMSHLDPADPFDMDMSSSEIEIELNMLEDEIARDEALQHYSAFDYI